MYSMRLLYALLQKKKTVIFAYALPLCMTPSPPSVQWAGCRSLTFWLIWCTIESVSTIGKKRYILNVKDCCFFLQVLIYKCGMLVFLPTSRYLLWIYIMTRKDDGKNRNWNSRSITRKKKTHDKSRENVWKTFPLFLDVLNLLIFSPKICETFDLFTHYRI